jgi:L-fucose isomerase-like protein
MCRTQIEVKLDGKVADLVSKTLGNHHVLTLGDFTEDLTEFCRLKNIEPLLL